MFPVPRRLGASLAALALAGCASFSDDGGFGAVAQLARERVGHTPQLQRTTAQSDAARARVEALLARELDAEAVVEIALLNHRGLQAAYAELGVAEAALVRAGRLPALELGLGRLHGNGVVEIDRSVVFDVLGLLSRPAAQRVEQQRFALAQLQAADATVAVAAQARKAFHEAVAARQVLAYQRQVQEAADLSHELARRMLAAGNFNRLAQLREQGFHADATAQLARAEHRATATLEQLVRALGLAQAPPQLRLPERLAELPERPGELRDAEQTALERRLDVRMARQAVAASAQALGLEQASGFVDGLHLGYQNKSATGEARSNGATLELAVPLDLGGTRTAAAQARHAQALHRAAAAELQARSEVREAHAAYRTAWTLARHYRDERVPLRQRISEEQLLRYNGMFASVFELLADAREQITTVTAAIDAQRAYWIAATDFQTALLGRSPGPLAAPGAAAEPTAPAGAGH